jgi:cholesterol transport system auxiliary component
MRNFVPSAVAALVGMTGCSSGFQSQQPVPQAYVLRIAPIPADPLPQQPSLQVARPLPHPGLESDRIVVMRSDRRLDYLAASRWAADVPELVEALVVDTFRHGGAFAAVQDSFGGFAPDYVLRIAVRRFDVDYTGSEDAPRAVVALDCVLRRQGDRDVVASFTAEGAIDARANRVGAIVAAFEGAARIALTAAAEQTYAALRGSPAEARTSRPP